MGKVATLCSERDTGNSVSINACVKWRIAGARAEKSGKVSMREKRFVFTSRFLFVLQFNPCPAQSVERAKKNRKEPRNKINVK